jgi:hypothetical protein
MSIWNHFIQPTLYSPLVIECAVSINWHFERMQAYTGHASEKTKLAAANYHLSQKKDYVR